MKQSTARSVSIVIPAYNEVGSVKELIKRINATMQHLGVRYEIIFVDDHSTDGTVPLVKSLAADYPVRLQRKRGEQGKAYSLLEGFAVANYPNIVMIDADLQYPPEAIPDMLHLMDTGAVDLVVANRTQAQTSFLRQAASFLNRKIVGRYLWHMDVDVQSGLKAFRREILDVVSLNPMPWTFDLEFLVQAQQHGYTIGQIPIVFAARKSGKTKLNLVTSTVQIVSSALQLKIKGITPN